jgi:hypothetical protein
MLVGTDRDQTRAVFFRAWRKFREGDSLAGVEPVVVVDIALRHPEYHAVLDNPETYEKYDFDSRAAQSNPFLHMGLHIAIHEQLSTDRPPGIRAAYHALRSRLDDAHAVEHRLMDCLEQTLWHAQRNGREPSASDYLECVRQDLARHKRSL